MRRHLREEHGLDPSRRVLDMELHILRDSDDGDVMKEPGRTVQANERGAGGDVNDGAESRGRGVPRSWLPRLANGFIGRDDIVERLTTSVAQSDHCDESLVWMIDGMPGIGKTTLAVHAARQVKNRYPDGQLFVDLHGHAEGSARKTSAALGMLLGQLGYPTAALPAGVDR